MIEFVELPRRPPEWDTLIRGFDTKTLFHESAWLDHVQSILPRAKIRYYQLARSGSAIGYYCAVRVRKMLLPIAGSPIGGTGTNYMGPVVASETDQTEFLRALARLCRREKIAHLELNNPWFDPETMRSEGFDVHESVTHMIDLPSTIDEAWQMLKSTCRNRIRKAQKNGLVVEITNDPALADRYQEQFQEVYAKQGMALPYTIEHPRSLLRHLVPAGRILPIWAKNGDEIVATGLFPYDEQCIYFWGGASWLRHQYLCPNELLQWTVIKEAVSRGIPRYDMRGGYSKFKDKFGGADVPITSYSRSSLPGLAAARAAYVSFHAWKLKALASPIGRLLSARS